MVTQCQQGEIKVLLSFFVIVTYNEVTAVHKKEKEK